MKTKLAILFALATAGAAFGAHAGFPQQHLPAGCDQGVIRCSGGGGSQQPVDVPIPSVGQPTYVPKLFPSEQGAFKALEVTAQLLESIIVQKGCSNTVFPLEVHTDASGNGTATVSDLFGGSVSLATTFVGAKSANGRQYDVASLLGGTLNGIAFANIKGHGSFNIGSTIQELNTSWSATSDVTTIPDLFSGTIIKDYVRLVNPVAIPYGFDDQTIPVSTVVDYGYQQISKSGYARAKFWQQSRFWREDGVNSGVYWLKTRVAPPGQSCAIEVKLQGYGQQPGDSIEGFNEKGYIAIKTADPGVYKAD